MYNRQVSAPILKRKSSRFGLGQFLSSATNNSNSANVAPPSHSFHHHLQINCAPPLQQTLPQQQQQQLHPSHYNFSLHHTSSAGTTPTTPNLLTAQQFQLHHQQHGYNINMGAPGRFIVHDCFHIFFTFYQFPEENVYIFQVSKLKCYWGENFSTRILK